MRADLFCLILLFGCSAAHVPPIADPGDADPPADTGQSATEADTGS